MRVDENGFRKSHFIQAFIVGDIFGGGFGVASHVDEDIRGAGGDEVWT